MQAATLTFREHANRALPLVSDFADQTVPSGILRQWADDLDLSDAIFDGTSLQAGKALPPYIRLADDLLLFANIADLAGAPSLFRSAANAQRAFNSPQAFARVACAPNAEEMLKLISRRIALNYPYVGFNESTEAGIIKFEIAIDNEFGLLGELLEHLYLVVLLQTSDHFRSHIGGRNEMNKPILNLRGGMQEWHDALTSSVDCIFQPTASTSCLRFPAVWARSPSVNYDPLLWNEAKKRLEALQATSGNSASIERLKRMVRIIVESEHRSPRLKEIAISEGLSERTLARRIANWGVTYQEIVDGIRAELAMAHLKREHESIDSIARSLGFSHSASFARAFRHWYGCSPTDWRSGVMAN